MVTRQKKAGICDKCGNALVQRDDDKPEAVAVRLDVYEKNTRPVLDYYAKQSLYQKVDGEGGTEEIFARLAKVIDTAVLP